MKFKNYLRFKYESLCAGLQIKTITHNCEITTKFFNFVDLQDQYQLKFGGSYNIRHHGYFFSIIHLKQAETSRSGLEVPKEVHCPAARMALM